MTNRDVIGRRRKSSGYSPRFRSPLRSPTVHCSSLCNTVHGRLLGRECELRLSSPNRYCSQLRNTVHSRLLGRLYGRECQT